VHRVDDRRAFSGIVYMRRRIWTDNFLCVDWIQWNPLIGLCRFGSLQSPPLSSERKRGIFNNAIGRPRGGQTTNALNDDIGCAHVLLITAGTTWSRCLACSQRAIGQESSRRPGPMTPTACARNSRSDRQRRSSPKPDAQASPS